jgi:hypothetical protein
MSDFPCGTCLETLYQRHQCIVPIANQVVAELEKDWSPPVRIKAEQIDPGLAELHFQTIPDPAIPDEYQGTCRSCGASEVDWCFEERDYE